MKKRCLLLLSSTLLLAFVANAQEPDQPKNGLKPTSKEERLAKLTEQLNREPSLTAKQKAAITASFDTFFADEEKIIAARDEKIKAVLTAEQFKKYLELEKRLRPEKQGKFKKNRREEDDDRNDNMPPPPPPMN